MTVLEVIQRSSEFLTRHGVDSPRLQIELLLAHVLQWSRLKLYLNFDRVLIEAELAALRSLVKRRAGREPLQHLLGSTSFCGFEIEVNRDVLIPRPETELLAERAIAHLTALEAPSATVLDFGTGSGCLAIAIAARCPFVHVHAVDVSPAALAVASRNAARHGVSERITFHCGDGFAKFAAEPGFDLLMSNPPYIATGEIAALQPEVRDHDPRLALDGGPDGLAFFQKLAVAAPGWLKAGAWALFEFGDGQDTALREMFTQAGWAIHAVEADDSGRARILIAQPP